MLFAIDASDVGALQAAASEEEVVHHAVGVIEERWDEEFLAQLDKAWYGIACCLNHLVEELHDHALAPDADRCVLGGQPLTNGEDGIVTLWEPAEARAGVAILQAVTEASLRHADDALDAEETKEYPEHGDEDFESVWSSFQAARELCVRAATARRAVLFVVDQ